LRSSDTGSWLKARPARSSAPSRGMCTPCCAVRWWKVTYQPRASTPQISCRRFISVNVSCPRTCWMSASVTSGGISKMTAGPRTWCRHPSSDLGCPRRWTPSHRRGRKPRFRRRDRCLPGRLRAEGPGGALRVCRGGEVAGHHVDLCATATALSQQRRRSARVQRGADVLADGGRTPCQRQNLAIVGADPCLGGDPGVGGYRISRCASHPRIAAASTV
jgi:hypothetical protein